MFFVLVVSYVMFSDVEMTLLSDNVDNKLDQDEKMMSAILGNRPRGFLLDLQSGSKAGVTSESELSYPGWKRVVNKVPSLQDLRESLSGLFSACQDVASEKVIPQNKLPLTISVSVDEQAGQQQVAVPHQGGPQHLLPGCPVPREGWGPRPPD